MTPILMFIALMGAHEVCDFPLQGEFLSKAKNPFTAIPGIHWTQAMRSHATIHGAAVALITGIWWMGILELAIHFATDTLKCHKEIDYNTDQMIHIGCKVLWFFIAVYVEGSPNISH